MGAARAVTATAMNTGGSARAIYVSKLRAVTAIYVGIWSGDGDICRYVGQRGRYVGKWDGEGDTCK